MSGSLSVVLSWLDKRTPSSLKGHICNDISVTMCVLMGFTYDGPAEFHKTAQDVTKTIIGVEAPDALTTNITYMEARELMDLDLRFDAQNVVTILADHTLHMAIRFNAFKLAMGQRTIPEMVALGTPLVQRMLTRYNATYTEWKTPLVEMQPMVVHAPIARPMARAVPNARPSAIARPIAGPVDIPSDNEVRTLMNEQKQLMETIDDFEEEESQQLQFFIRWIFFCMVAFVHFVVGSIYLTLRFGWFLFLAYLTAFRVHSPGVTWKLFDDFMDPLLGPIQTLLIELQRQK
jgi:hypothetical protein